MARKSKKNDGSLKPMPTDATTAETVKEIIDDDVTENSLAPSA